MHLLPNCQPHLQATNLVLLTRLWKPSQRYNSSTNTKEMLHQLACPEAIKGGIPTTFRPATNSKYFTAFKCQLRKSDGNLQTLIRDRNGPLRLRRGSMIMMTKSKRMKWTGHVVRMGEMRNTTKFWLENLRRRHHLGDLGADGRTY